MNAVCWITKAKVNNSLSTGRLRPAQSFKFSTAPPDAKVIQMSSTATKTRFQLERGSHLV